mgnify:CR=1 FL=1
MKNLILDTDSYKMSHFLGYPEGTTEMYSYLESRGGKYSKIPFIGLQPILKKLEQGVDIDDVDEALEFSEKHGLPFNYQGWKDIVYEHNGKLPVEIRALPEGSVVPSGIPMLTIRNTDHKHAWLTSYLETLLLRVWYPMTVAARINVMKNNIKPYFEMTSDEGEVSPFAILDFSSRGVSSREQSEVGGLGYLVHFLGSDNVPAVDFVNKLYHSDMSGFSVPATEHSIMCAFGEESEKQSFEYLVENMGQEGGILSVVSDTWDIFRATDTWMDLAEKIKEKNLTLVIRPDSGDIEEVLPAILDKALESWPYYHINTKGYVVFDNLKILWGDGINEETGFLPFAIAKHRGISADSIMTGSGGGLMQANIDRDTCKLAIKGSNVIVNGESRPISKSPVTDKGKRSKEGKFSVFRHSDGSWDWSNDLKHDANELRLVFKNGYSYSEYTIDNVRERIKNQG